MLLAIRDKAQGWIAWAIVIFISIPFALWGINEYFGVGGAPIVATVDGYEISERDLDRRTREQRDSLRSRLGQAYRADLFPEAILRQQVLDELINARLLVQAANDWNLGVGESAVRDLILSIPAFQRDGRFNSESYQTALRNSGMSRAQFEQGVRRDMLLSQMREAVTATSFVTETERRLSQQLKGQKRQIQYLIIPASEFSQDVTVTEELTTEYYRTHEGDYLLPERVKLDYLLLDINTVAGTLVADEEQLRDYYEQHKKEFRAPEERRLRHILITLPADAGDEATQQANETITGIRERLSAGEAFDVLAKEFSQDPGSANDGGDLGWVEPGMMAPAFDQAAFALDKGSLSEPVKTSFGLHLIELLDVRSGGAGSFELLRDLVEKAYRQSEAERLYYDRAERLADLVYETPDSLVPAVDMLELQIMQSDWLAEDGLPDAGNADLRSPKVAAAAFSEDVLNQGLNSEVIELSAERLLVVRVAEHQEQRLQSLDEVRSDVQAAVINDQSIKEAEKRGLDHLERLRAGASLLEIAAERNWELSEHLWAGRQDAKVSREILNQAFQIARPKSGEPMIEGLPLRSGDYALLRLDAVKDGMASDIADASSGQADLMQRQQGRAELRGLVQALRSDTDISINTRPENAQAAAGL